LTPEPADDVGRDPQPGPRRLDAAVDDAVLEEADELADQIAVVDHGRIIARGTADDLKAQVGGERVEVVVRSGADVARARDLLAAQCGAEAIVDRAHPPAHRPGPGGSSQLVDVIRSLDEAGIPIDDVALRRPLLDDVFLSLTGHVAQDDIVAHDKVLTGRTS
jgi:ABC-2 type transport system ATP-binding protein